MQETVCKNLIETVLSIHERIRKFQTLRTNNQVSSSSICKYNLLQKADTLLESLQRPGNVSRIFRVQELRYRKCILYRKKNRMYIIN